MKNSALKRFISLIFVILLMCSLCACGESKAYDATIFAMDTTMSLRTYGKYGEAGLSAASAIIQSLDKMLDPELTTSMVYSINHANGEAVVVSGQIAKMIETAKTVYDQTGGALDLTLYPLIQLWNIHDGKGYVPNDDEISKALSRLCFDEVILTSFPSSGSYTVSIPDYAQISFAAVAKGCASDYAIEAIKNCGVESAVISLGGNVRTLGTKPNGDKWDIAIQDPNDLSSYLGILSVGEAAVVTSGSYQRYFTDSTTGTTYHHIFKPSTGYPATNTLSSVTIVSDDGTLADCLSTAMFVLGESAAINYWKEYGADSFEMILVTTDNRVRFTTGLIEQFELTNTTDYTLDYIHD